VARLELQLGSSEHVHQLVADLSTPLILPALNTLCIRSSELLPTHLTSLTDMLHARRIAPSSLDSFDVQLNVSVGWKPPPAVLAALQVLVNDGLHIRMELVCRVRSETSTVIESGENGAYIIFNSSASSNKLQVFHGDKTFRISFPFFARNPLYFSGTVVYVFSVGLDYFNLG
jgi:hypothetical protein